MSAVCIIKFRPFFVAQLLAKMAITTVRVAAFGNLLPGEMFGVEVLKLGHELWVEGFTSCRPNHAKAHNDAFEAEKHNGEESERVFLGDG